MEGEKSHDFGKNVVDEGEKHWRLSVSMTVSVCAEQN